MATVRVLFVCMGNICRSPTAEGVFSKLVQDAALESHIEVDSAGTGGWHAGEPPDRRAQAEGKRRGVNLAHLKARQVRKSDFEAFNFVIAMDRQNMRELNALCPPDYRERVRLFLDFAPHREEREVPDPYYGGQDGFVYVYDLVEEASRGLLAHIQQEHGLAKSAR